MELSEFNRELEKKKLCVCVCVVGDNGEEGFSRNMLTAPRIWAAWIKTQR